MVDPSFVVPILVLALAGILAEALRKLVDICLTSWALRHQGVPEDEIHKIAIAKAKRQRNNLVLQVLDRLASFFKK